MRRFLALRNVERVVVQARRLTGYPGGGGGQVDDSASDNKRTAVAREVQRGPKVAGYVVPALRNAPGNSHMPEREVATRLSHTAVLQKRDRDPQEVQDARRGDPETRLAPPGPATINAAFEQLGAMDSGSGEALKKKRTRRGKRAGRPRVLWEQEQEVEEGVVR
ncbi:hypothetical protein FRC10_003043 [Ceratobasidium sp. 414]|nr:hypothetical protein FRC10_003043 [Ceratobasidium sp. 414]